MINKVIEVRTGRIWLGDDGIIRATTNPETDLTLADAKEQIEATAKIGRDERLPVLVDFSNMRSQDRECRAYFAGEETAKAVRACAILVTSPVGRVIGSFFMGLNKPVAPTKLFTSETEAIEWLKRFLE